MRKLSIILFALSMSIGLWAQIIPSGDKVACGKSVRITATEKEGYEFVKWSDEVTDNPRVVAVNDAVNLTAIFKLKQYTLDPATFGEGVTLNGSATPITVTMGQSITAQATSIDPCEEFNKWSDDNTENPRTFTYDGTATPFTVVYGTKLFTVTANASATEGNILIELVP
jgi:hypothetical protein